MVEISGNCLHCIIFVVNSLATMSCLAPPQLSSQPPDDKVITCNCVRYHRCSNDPATELPTNAINCSVPESINQSISGNCYLWGRDGPHQQMLFIYLLKISPHKLTLHYFNDSYGSQQHLSMSRQQLCSVNNFDIAKVINQSCMGQGDAPAVLQNKELECCSANDISISFNRRRMEIYIRYFSSFIKLPVDYSNCPRKS